MVVGIESSTSGIVATKLNSTLINVWKLQLENFMYLLKAAKKKSRIFDYTLSYTLMPNSAVQSPLITAAIFPCMPFVEKDCTLVSTVPVAATI